MTARSAAVPRRSSHEIEIHLIERLRHRDPAALAELYDLFGGRAYSLVLRIVRDAGVAEDLVQETFLRVWTHSQRFDPTRGPLGPWLLAVARNCSVDYLRYSGRRGRCAAVGLNEIEDPRLFTDLERSVWLSATRDTLCEALGKLNIDQRAVIELAYFEGLSQTEMATRLGRPLGTVKTWVRGALRLLADQLRQRQAAEANMLRRTVKFPSDRSPTSGGKT